MVENLLSLNEQSRAEVMELHGIFPVQRFTPRCDVCVASASLNPRRLDGPHLKRRIVTEWPRRTEALAQGGSGSDAIALACDWWGE
jgi:hypothetical protein